MLGFPASSMIFHTISLNFLATSEFGSAKSTESMVFDNRLSAVLKAALPIFTASPDRLLFRVSARSSCTFLRRIFWLASSAALENSWPLHILRRFLHWLETSSHGMPNSPCSWARSASGMVRFDKTWSCF